MSKLNGSWVSVYLNCFGKNVPVTDPSILKGLDLSKFVLEPFTSELTGCPDKSLLKLLMDNLKDRNLVMNTLEEFNEIKYIARCKQCWRNLL